MPRSRPELADVHCPCCGRPFQAAVWLVVDRAERPDLVHALLEGQLDVAVCPHCGAEGSISHPLLLHDPDRQQVLCALPLSVQGQDAARELVGDLLHGLVAAIPVDERRPYLGEVEFVPELDGLRAALVEQALAEDSAVEDRLLAAALEELLNTGGQLDFQRVIAEHRQLLLADRAEEALDTIFQDARRVQDRELQRRAREARAILGRMRSIVLHRRRTLAVLLDDLAPLSEDELQVLPQLKLMLDAIDPQEVYAARIALAPEEQATLDGLVERLAAGAEAAHEPEALTFMRNLQALPRQ
jgi:hypothetical protein